jgi:catechol 2,3-dioxygenase-like lactoylglutathione lyase family enzyme
MAVDALQHVNIRATDVERSRDFYERIVGLTVGDRPPFASFGYWLYLGPTAVIHLVQRPESDVRAPGTGIIDHLAFRGVSLSATRALLEQSGVPFREELVQRDNTVQLFIHDPDGVKIELNFDPPQS